MRFRLGLVLVASLLVAIQGAGSDQRVVLQADLHAPPGQEAVRLPAVLSLESVSDAKQPAVRLPLTVPGAAETLLPPGVWRAEVRGDRLFHQGQIIIVPAAAPVRSMLDVWQTGTITGRLEVAEGILPKAIEVRWNASERVSEAARHSSAAPPPGARTCTVDQGTFACQVPLGEHDLRLRAETYVSKYLWSIQVREESRDLGLFSLDRGASIVGWVKPERGVTGDLTKAVVEIQSEALKKPITAPVHARGFFHLERIAPGDYVLNARLGEISAEPRTVHVSRDAESELIDGVVLSRPRTLAVQVTPARSSSDRAWQMRLERVNAGGRTQAVARGTTDAAGRIEWRTLRPGAYSIIVAEDSRSAVAFRELEVSDEETEVAIDVPRTPVRGRVTLRDRGVQVRLWLGGRNRVPSVEVRTGEDGRFSAMVPFDPAEEWLVSLESRTPRILRTLRQKPSVNDVTGEARLEIALPENVVAGRVVDERGGAVERAIVNLAAKTHGADNLLQTNVDSDGTFEFDGLASGTYEIQANDFQQQQSDLLTVVVGDDPYQDVELVVRKKRTVIGRVVAPSGQPVPGVEVTAFPSDRPFIHVASAMTDADGVFSLDLPADARGMDFMIAANGLALKAFHVPAPENGLTILADSTGGQIVFDVPQFVDDPAALHPWFSHKGAWIAVRALMYLPAARVESSQRGPAYLSLIHPLVDDGNYSVCMLRGHEVPAVRSGAFPQGRCTSGYLSPWGSLSLETPAKE